MSQFICLKYNRLNATTALIPLNVRMLIF